MNSQIINSILSIFSAILLISILFGKLSILNVCISAIYILSMHEKSQAPYNAIFKTIISN